MVGSVLAIAVVVVGGFFALRSVTIKEAVRDTRESVEAQGRLVDGRRPQRRLLTAIPQAIAKLDGVVARQVLDRPSCA